MQIEDEIKELAETFGMLAEMGEDAKYEYIIDLGKKLPPMPEAEITEANKVRGCISQVWLTHQLSPDNPPRLQFNGTSDSTLVKGLIGLLLKIVSNRTPQEILSVDLRATFAKLGIENQISPNRRNGFVSMVERIKQLAAAQV